MSKKEQIIALAAKAIPTGEIARIVKTSEAYVVRVLRRD